ncbi:unnamed protein product [Musa acuminata subsp. malaccensis]|uniref:(wild Malaysian banana) hypothetical protein n=1 Tax=Musa acuminata subsp. malaccensis TaxID=214687 RepID=A0A804HYY7_MUSAM|nr:unnamed protein product [Musa acuminata subsp. malaccensis]
MAVSWSSAIRISLLVLLVAAVVAAFFTLPVQKILNDFLVWIKQNVGPWGPVVLAVAYIPLTILAVPASILSVLLGQASFKAVVTWFNSYPHKLRDWSDVSLVPSSSSWTGQSAQPITLALVYVGTTFKDLADVTHRWNEVSSTHWVLMVTGLAISAILMVCVTRETHAYLDKALVENTVVENILIITTPPSSPPPPPPVSPESPLHLQQPLMIKMDTSNVDRVK